MEFFELRGGVLKVKDPTILNVNEFNEIWEGDGTEEKEVANQWFKFLWLYCDYKSPFNDFPDKERKDKSLERCNLKESDVNSSLMKDAIKIYLEIENANPVIQAINSAKTLLHKIVDYVNVVDFDEKIEGGAQKGKLVHSIAEARKTIREMPDIVDTLKELRKAYLEEIKEIDSTRKNTAKGLWDDLE